MTETKDEANASQVCYIQILHLQGDHLFLLAMDISFCFNRAIGELLT
jgi:hypothetical protein